MFTVYVLNEEEEIECATYKPGQIPQVHYLAFQYDRIHLKFPLEIHESFINYRTYFERSTVFKIPTHYSALQGRNYNKVVKCSAAGNGFKIKVENMGYQTYLQLYEIKVDLGV